MELGDILATLKSHGVKRFEIEFDQVQRSSVAEQHAVNVPVGGSNPSAGATNVPGGQVIDLPGANDVMSYDKILNWSASPDPAATEKEEIKGTGDQPMEAAT